MVFLDLCHLTSTSNAEFCVDDLDKFNTDQRVYLDEATINYRRDERLPYTIGALSVD